jgi:HD-like signal output (HDOD) protein
MPDTSAIQTDIFHKIETGELNLPSLPDIALRVRKAIQNEDYTTVDIARIVQSDIPLTARLIQIANSPLYRGVVPVEHCHQAISRLGLKVTRNLVTSFTLRRTFNAKNEGIRKKIENVWKHSVKVAAIGFTLARVSPKLDPDRAMLAGLLHDIGVLPVYTFVEQYPSVVNNDTEVSEIAQSIRAQLGEMILRHWRFEDAFVDVARDAENWFREGGEQPDYADVIIIAQLHAMHSETTVAADLPAINEVPAFKKFPVFKFGENASIELMHEAQEEMQELQRLLIG